MVGIKDFELPICCLDCPMLDDSETSCRITWSEIDFDVELQRADDCPLVEMEEE